MHSATYLSKQTIYRFVHATSSMMESGLYEFYTSMANFWFNIENRLDLYADEDEDKVKGITVYEFRYPLSLCGSLLLFALTIFISEWFWFCIGDKCRAFSKRFKRRFTRFLKWRS